MNTEPQKPVSCDVGSTKEHLLRLGVGSLALLLTLGVAGGLIGVIVFYCWVFLQHEWPWYCRYGTVVPLVITFAYFIGWAMRDTYDNY